MMRTTIVALIMLSLVGCGGVKTYKEDVVTGGSAQLILEAKAKTLFAKKLSATLFDYQMIESGKACKKQGIFSKSTSVEDALYGAIKTTSKKKPITKLIPADKPLRAYVEFYDKSGNSVFINHADIVFLPKKGKTYKFIYKRDNFSSGSFTFLEKTRNGFKEIKNIGDFDFNICDKYF